MSVCTTDKEHVVSIDDNKAVVTRLVDSINTRALDRLAELVSSDVVDHNAVIFMQPEGPGGVEEGIRMLLVGFPDLRLDVHELIGEVDSVVVRLTVSGTNLGEYRGLPQPTNSASKWTPSLSSASRTERSSRSAVRRTALGCSCSSGSSPTSADHVPDASATPVRLPSPAGGMPLADVHTSEVAGTRVRRLPRAEHAPIVAVRPSGHHHAAEQLMASRTRVACCRERRGRMGPPPR